MVIVLVNIDFVIELICYFKIVDEVCEGLFFCFWVLGNVIVMLDVVGGDVFCFEDFFEYLGVCDGEYYLLEV